MITTTKLDDNFFGATDGEFDGCGKSRAAARANLLANREAADIEQKIKEKEES